MGMLEDVMKTLERIPLWKRLGALPEQVEALQLRVQELEAQLAGRTGPLCPLCNAPGFKVASSKPDPIFGEAGIIRDTHICRACNHSEERTRDAMHS